MREIKFRAWTGSRYEYFNVLSGLYGFFNPIIEQYTGLKDKNGKEIFEGDICKIFTDTPSEIIFHDGCFGYKCNGEHYFISFSENKWFKWVGCNSDEIEVIGNIHENPELL